MQTRMQTRSQTSSILNKIIKLFHELATAFEIDKRIELVIEIYKHVDELYKKSLLLIVGRNEAKRKAFIKAVIFAVERLTQEIKEKMSEKIEIDEEYSRMEKCIKLMHRVKKNYKLFL
jgi:hypothetical protein